MERHLAVPGMHQPRLLLAHKARLVLPVLPADALAQPHALEVGAKEHDDGKRRSLAARSCILRLKPPLNS